MADNNQQAQEQGANVQTQQTPQPEIPQENIEPIGNLDPPVKADWFEVTMANPGVSTDMLMQLYGADGFNELKPREEYWKNEKLRKDFTSSYGFFAQDKFNDLYDNKKKQYAAYKLGQFTKSQTGFELIRDSEAGLRADVSVRFENMAGSLERGESFSDPTKDYRENFVNVRIRKVDANGNETFEIKAYSPLLLEELEQDDSFGGLAYSDAFRAIDPNKGVNGVFFDTIHGGKVYNDETGGMEHVRNDQVVSRWDIETGSLLDGVLKNNKLEANSVFDYAKIIAKAPINMWANLMDTGVQLSRATIAGYYGITNKFREEKLDVTEQEIFKWFSTAGIKWKSRQTSLTQEALTKGFFGSLEAALSTTAEIALQVGLARGLSVVGAGVAGIVNRGLTGAALQQAEQRYAMVSVRSILTSMAAKDSYNEAIETGYTPTEASMITGAMSIALWQATKYASYILGDYEGKIIRNNIKLSIQEELRGNTNKMLKAITKTVPPIGQNEAKAGLFMRMSQKVVDKVFVPLKGAASKLPSQQWIYAARQEGFEEMTEELYQDVVKHGASAYSVLLNNAASVGKGRYMTIFDDGFFKDAAERYATSAVAGAMGGPMGMVGNRVNLNNITPSSSVVDIILGGHKTELVNILEGMRENGELGPKELSVVFNEAEGIFEPVIQGSSQDNLSDMVYNTYMHDVNVIDTFLRKGLFGNAMARVSQDAMVRNNLEQTSMRKDFASLMGSLLDFHTRTGISTSVYAELDAMSDKELYERLPVEVQKASANRVAKQNELKKFQESVDAKNAKAAKEDADPKTTDKAKTNKLGESEEDKLSRLEKEVELSSETSNDEITNLLNMYRKIRSISNGTASEYYLVQNEVVDDTVLGSMDVRDPDFIKLGENPIYDIFNGARNRLQEDKLIQAQRIKKSIELDETMASEFKDFDVNLDTQRLIRKIRRSEGLLSDKALKAIVKLYKPASVKTGQNFLDPSKQEFLFNNKEGEMNEDKMIAFTLEVLSLNPLHAGETKEEILRRIRSSKLHIDLFKNMSKNLDKAIIPFTDQVLDGTREYELSKTGPDLLSNLNLIESPEAEMIVNNILSPELLLVRAAAKKAEADIKHDMVFNQEAGIVPSAEYLYKYAENTEMSALDLVEVGLSEVEDLLASKSGEEYTKKDSDNIGEVLEQIKVKQAISNLVTKFTKEGLLVNYSAMLTGFRKSTLDILDFDYDVGEKGDTSIEVHPYKDYTVMSDFFTDFLYDPMHINSLRDKDEKLRTEADNKEVRRIQDAQVMSGTIVSTTGIPGEGENKVVTVDWDKVHDYLNIQYNMLAGSNDMKKALADLDKDTIAIPLKTMDMAYTNEDDLGYLVLQGMSKLKVAEWLFKRTKRFIEDAKLSKGDLPYLQNKKIEIEAATALFADISTNIEGLGDNIAELVPEFGVYLSSRDKALMSTNELGAMNIKVEKAIYDIYNGIEFVSLGKGTFESIKAGLDNEAKLMMEIMKESSNIKDNESKRNAVTLIGALTTDFTPFYSKFRAEVEKDLASDDAEFLKDRKVVLSAQETSAKYAAGFVYSPAFRKMIYKLTVTDETQGLSPETIKNNYIDSIFISGVAGSGKTSAVTELGMNIAIAILKDSGITTTAVLPVANNESQVEIISKSVGDLSEGLEGLVVDDLVKLLRSATIENDKKSMDKLDMLATIVIDEVTYINAVRTGKPSDLKFISNLINTYNTNNRVNNLPISLIIMGDPHQSGATEVNAVGAVESTKMDFRNSFSLPYMNYSFRGRNSFLVSSVAALQRVTDTVQYNKGISADTEVIIGKGLRFGTQEGTYYGVNIINSQDPDTSGDFIKMMNEDTDLYNSIVENIKKDPTFRVLIAPESITEWEANRTRMHELIDSDEYAHAFKVIPYKKVGGSEANYILAEFPANLFGPGFKTRNTISMRETKDSLNTLITRAKDFAVIINKNDDIVIPSESTPKNTGDGHVMLTPPSLDEVIKKTVRENYINIFDSAGIVAGDTVLPADKNVTPPVDSSPTDLDKDATRIITEDMKNLIDNNDVPIKGDKLDALMSNAGFYDQPTIVNDYISSLIDLAEYNNNPEKDLEALQEDVENKYDALEKTLSDTEKSYFINLNALAHQVAINTSPDSSTATAYLTNALKTTEDEIDTIVNKEPLLARVINEGEPVTVEDMLLMVGTNLEGPHITLSDIEVSLEEDIEEDQLVAYNELIKSYIEEVAVSQNLDITPPKLSTELYDELAIEVKKVVRARAVEITPTEFEGFPDVEASNQIFSEIKLWAMAIEPDQLARAIGDIDAALADPSIQSINMSNKVDDLLEKYSRNSVLVNTRKVLNEVYVRLKSDDRTSADIIRLAELKSNLGISPEVVHEIDLYNAMKDIGDSIGRITSDDPVKIQQARNLIEMEMVWNNLFRTEKDPDTAITGNLYYNRQLDRVQTRDDFIRHTEALDGKNEMYTVPITRTEATTVLKPWLERETTTSFDPNYHYVIPKKPDGSFDHTKALNLFNFDGSKGRVPDKLEIRVMRQMVKGLPRYDFQVVAIRGNTKYVISKIFTGGGEAQHRLVEGLKTMAGQRIDEAIVAKSNGSTDPRKNVNVVNGVHILDLPLSGPLKALIKTRAGEGKTSDGTMASVQTMAQLEETRSVSSDLFVMTSPSGFNADGTTSMNGELMALYSSNKGGNIDSADITKQLKQGETLSKNLNVTDKSGGIVSNVGMVGINIKVPFAELAAVYNDDPKFVLGEFVSNMSLTIQKYISDKLGDIELKVGDIIPIQIAGALHKIAITDAMKAEGVLMANEFRAYVGKEGSDHSNKIDSSLKQISEDVSARTTMETLFGAHVKAMNTKGKNPNVRASSSITFDAKRQAYKFNINRFIGKDVQPTKTIVGLDAIAAATNYTISPPISRSDTDTANIGVVSRAFTDNIPKKYLITSLASVGQPLFSLTSNGIAELHAGLQIPKAAVIRLTADEIKQRNAVKDFFAESNIEERSPLKVGKETELEAVDRLIIEHEEMEKKVATLENSDKKASSLYKLTDNLLKLRNWKKNVKVIGEDEVDPNDYDIVLDVRIKNPETGKLEDVEEIDEKGDSIRTGINNIIIDNEIEIGMKVSILNTMEGIKDYKDFNALYITSQPEVVAAMKATGVEPSVLEKNLQSLIDNCKFK